MKKIKELKVIQRIQSIKSKIKDKWSSFLQKNYSATEKSKVWLFNILVVTIIGSLFLDSGLPPILGYLIFAVLAFIVMNLLRIVVTFLLTPLLHKSAKPAVYTVMILILIFSPIYTGSFIMSMPVILLISMLVTFIEILFARSLWSFFRYKRKSLTIILSLIITGLLNVMMGVLLVGEGFGDKYIEQYISLNNKTLNEELNGDKVEVQNGSLAVTQIEYGAYSDNSLEDETTDLTSYIGDYNGITSMVRGMYWGYDIDQVPLTGKIWYPTEGSNYPVMFIIHGNHNMTTKSYLGYDYLGEYLASNGYVVVSVDESFCNGYINMGLSSENDARAILLLENMQLVESYNNDEAGILYGKIDFDNIALAGHSRGGESVATAALFNSYDYYPDNGNIKFNYDFNIKTLIAISPTVDQYKPADHEVELSNVNYFLIHGANDQDVTDFMGNSQYHNITFEKDSGYFKSYLYIAGANHGQFNTEWGRYDLPEPFKPFLNTKNLLDAEGQRNILKVYAKEFLDATLKQDRASAESFAHNTSRQYDLPETVYIGGYQDSTFDLLCGFDEDSNIKYGNTAATRLDSDYMSVWREVKNPISYGTKDHVLKLVWNDTKEANYSIDLSSYNNTGGYLQFDIMDIMDRDYQGEDFKQLDARITLKDSQGNESSLRMTDYITIYPPLPVRQFKLQYLTNSYDYKYCFQTVQLPGEEFEKVNSNFDSSSIVSIKFSFNENENGSVMLDNIGFGK
ncbi:MAG: hypothetical protein QM644_14665 [Mobilitalea sp.]